MNVQVIHKRIHRPFRTGISLSGLRKVELGFDRHLRLKSDIYRQAFQHWPNHFRVKTRAIHTKGIHRPFRTGSSLAGLRRAEFGFDRHSRLKSDIYSQAS